jgi:hypothetical protein
VKQESIISLGYSAPFPPLGAPRKKMRIRTRILVALGVLVLLSAFVDACAPEIDNEIGIWRHFDIRAVKDLNVDGKRLGQVIQSRYHLVSWQSSHRPAILTEYIWFPGHPVAQSDTAGATSWTFTDHLGTPILQTSAAQGITWRAEYEPYGAVYNLRSLDQHQPLRLPGQEAEQLNSGANGVGSRSYNINRWYEPAAGR